MARCSERTDGKLVRRDADQLASTSTNAKGLRQLVLKVTGVEKLALREQVGPDFLWLVNPTEPWNQAVVEIYRIHEGGVFTRHGLIYRRPITNVLYRDGTAVVQALEHLIV